MMKKTIMSFVLAGFVCSAAAQVMYIPASFKEIADKVGPSVVNISTVKVLRRSHDPYYDKFFNDEFMRRFFGIPQQNYQRRNLGSGFIVSKDGYIITNYHVVSGADEITVRLSDRKEYRADIVGSDRETDIAVIKIKGKNLPAAELGDSDAVNVGDWVVAIGSPFGLEQTVTQGIISAKSRIIGAGAYDDFLQTDAAINPGNSGGPLVNLKGEVIGINTAISTLSGGYEGVGFAIPINLARKIYEDLAGKGRVERGWLGVSIQELTPELSEHFKAKEGVLISGVFSNGPADKGGIKRGDVITEFGGKKISAYRELQSLVAGTPVGKTVKVKIIRDGKSIERKVKIGERNIERAFEPEQPAETGGLGIAVSDITDEIAGRYGISKGRGVVVISVDPDSSASESGVMPGDVIHEMNGNVIRRMDDFKKASAGIKKGSRVIMLIERSDSMVYLAFRVR